MTFSHVDKSLDARLISVRVANVHFATSMLLLVPTIDIAEKHFFNETMTHYLNIATPYVVIGGDFNAVARTRDASGSSNLSPTLQRVTYSSGLLDSWIIQHPIHVEFSSIRSNCKSRIDRIYISEEMKSMLRNTFFTPVAFSDH